MKVIMKQKDPLSLVYWVDNPVETGLSNCLLSRHFGENELINWVKYNKSNNNKDKPKKFFKGEFLKASFS